jgi:hypothetical protein
MRVGILLTGAHNHAYYYYGLHVTNEYTVSSDDRSDSHPW